MIYKLQDEGPDHHSTCCSMHHSMWEDAEVFAPEWQPPLEFMRVTSGPPKKKQKTDTNDNIIEISSNEENDPNNKWHPDTAGQRFLTKIPW